MWMLSQRAMRRVAMDLAAQQGVSEQRWWPAPWPHANQVLNVEDEDLGGTVVLAQLAHIARHKAFCASSFGRPNCRAHTPDFSAPAGRVPQSPESLFRQRFVDPGLDARQLAHALYIGGDVRWNGQKRTCAGACTRGQSRRRPR